MLTKGPLKKKEVQFAILFHLLSQGHSMIEYEGMRALLEYLKVPKLPKKHWSDTAGWEMAESIHRIIKERAAEILGSARWSVCTSG